MNGAVTAVSAAVFGVLTLFGAAKDAKAQTERVTPAWEGAKLENPKNTPIELHVKAEDIHPFISGWKNTANAPPTMGEQTRYEAGFSLQGIYGRIRAFETTVTWHWNPTTAGATIKAWKWVNDHSPVVGSGGKLDHGRVEFSYVRFQLTNKGATEDCFGYVGAQDRWQIDGYTCGKLGQFVSEAAIGDFIRAIGYPHILTPTPVALPQTSATAG